MTSPLGPPEKPAHCCRRVAILFAGGPAPAANAVISTAAASFLRAGSEVIGIKHGYQYLEQYNPERPLVEGTHYVRVTHAFLKRSRNSQGILIGTSRANPGRDIKSPADLTDPSKAAPLRRVYEALRSLDVEAMISIGGDDTLTTANKFKVFQQNLPPDQPRIPIVHVPKTIDNDYMGIDFTFGYFTAVQTLAEEIRNLIYDAEANSAYFVAETMGRRAGWLAYGAAIAGEASLVVSVEDLVGDYVTEETVHDEKTNRTITRKIMNLPRLVNRMVRTMLAREQEGKEFGVIVVAEGLAEYLPWEHVKDAPRDEHGHLNFSHVQVGRKLAAALAQAYREQTGKKRKVIGVQLGYESRCARPHAFDVMLGSQLGVGAYRALAEKRLDGVMVSVAGQLELRYVPFEELVDPQTLLTRTRYIDPDSDFHRLARFLETYVNE